MKRTNRCAVYMGVVALAGLPWASWSQELPAISLSQIKAEAAAPAVGSVSAAPLSNWQIAAAAVKANAMLDDFERQADLSAGSAGLQQTMRKITGSMFQATSQVNSTIAKVKAARSALQSSGDIKAASDAVLDSILGTIGSALSALDIVPYKSELDNLKEKQPYSGVRLGQIAMVTSMYNLQRALNEMRKETYAMSLEINAKAAALGTEGIDQETLDDLDYAKHMASDAADWKEFDQKISAITAGAPQDFKTKVTGIQAYAVYDWPQSN